MTWYFAYGSNLWIDQMVARIGLRIGVEQPRIVRLPGYRFAFNMRGENGKVYANIVPNPENYVLGVIYWCDAAALKKLDIFEKGYYRKQVLVVADTGETVEADTYMAKLENEIDGRKPSAEYVQRILRGGRQHELPEEYLNGIQALAGG